MNDGPEAEIVWLEDIDKLDYVREWETDLPHRARRPSMRYHPGRLVGYSTVGPTVKGRSGMFRRRIFWLALHDRDSGDPCYRTGGPCEAVDPRTVKPNVLGKTTERSWGRPIRGD